MTEIDACMRVLRAHREKHARTVRELREEYMRGAADEWDDYLLEELVDERHDAAVRRNLLDQILADLEDRVADMMQAEAMGKGEK